MSQERRFPILVRGPLLTRFRPTDRPLPEFVTLRKKQQEVCANDGGSRIQNPASPPFERDDGGSAAEACRGR